MATATKASQGFSLMAIINEPLDIRRYSLIWRLVVNIACTLCMECYVIGCKVTDGGKL
jgi:hypothetical protein